MYKCELSGSNRIAQQKFTPIETKRSTNRTLDATGHLPFGWHTWNNGSIPLKAMIALTPKTKPKSVSIKINFTICECFVSSVQCFAAHFDGAAGDGPPLHMVRLTVVKSSNGLKITSPWAKFD